jgi:putative SOS response-associated peptidase YedK
MCTNFALIKTDGTAELASRLLVDAAAFRYHNDFRPGSTISIVTSGVAGETQQRQVLSATWWLYLKQTDAGLKPHRDYFSVNTNYRKLPNKPEYRTSRCIVPASAFVESQAGKRPHLLTPSGGSGIAFGGLYKEWTDRTTGEIVWSASIITLPGHPALENIHRKSTPLWLPADAYDSWLSPHVTDTSVFDELLKPALQTDLVATPIDKAGSKQPIAESFTIQR